MAYSSREYANMLMCLGEAQGNAALGLRIYRERYPTARHPADARVLTGAYQRVLENLPIVPRALGGGRSTDTVTEARTLEVVRRDPRLGTRSASRVMRGLGRRICHTTVHSVLRRNKMRPYVIRKVQALVPGDQQRRREYCRWLLQQERDVGGFISKVIWTDESCFTRNGIWNRRNSHIWADSNPHAVQETGHQTRWSVNVWAGIYHNQILGPVFLPQRLTGHSYLEFINDFVVNFMDEMCLADYKRTWFQHDGAPPHVIRPVRDRLNTLFGEQWIGRFGPQAWPPRSPDLTPMDFFLWGYIKGKVFCTECGTAEEMRERILAAFATLRQDCANDPSMLPRLHRRTWLRARACLDFDGAQFEPQLTRRRR